jgi:hypothetical protein
LEAVKERGAGGREGDKMNKKEQERDVWEIIFHFIKV